MRFFKALLAVCAAAVMAFSTFAVAQAFITDSSGSLIQLSSPPPSVALNALENATSAFAFNEAQGFALTAPLAVDITDPGTYSTFPVGRTTIPAGTLVDSQLIHSDPPSSVHYTARRSGSVTVADDILGVIVTTKNLAASDGLGAPGTIYSGKLTNRGLDLGQDSLTLSADHRTVSFDIQTNASSMDEIRIVTVHTNRLVTTITDSPDPVQAGGNVTYLVTVTNPTPIDVPDVQLADAFPGATFLSANAPGPCTGNTTSATCGLGTIPAGGSASATIVVTSSSAAGGGMIVNTATAPAGEDPVATEVTTVVDPVLDTTIADAPDPVTAGNDVQYVLTVTNNGIAAVADAHVTDTLPADTTLASATAAGGCTGSGPVDCALGPLGVGESAQATLIVTSPATVPGSGTITDKAVASPGTNTEASQVTTVQGPTPGTASGYVSPGDSITIPGDDPATITLPNTGDGAPVVVTQGDGTFCDNGPCTGTVTTIAPIDGYNDPHNPIHLELIYNFPSSPTSLKDAGRAYFLEQIYKNTDPGTPNAGSLVPDCTTPGAGSAIPSPCVDSRDLVETSLNTYVVTFDIVYLSGDPSFGKR
jgi:uncharacterized repeat protein (TIGR01451 family)